MFTIKYKSNERLEFVGDGVLECITKYELYVFLRQMNIHDGKIALVKWQRAYCLWNGITWMVSVRKCRTETNTF